MVREVAIPESYVVDKSPMILNQGDQRACVGFSTAGTKTDEEFLQRKRRYRFDGQWLYNECKKIDGYPNEEGTEIRVALKIVNQRGIKRTGWFQCPSKKWGIAAYYRIGAASTMSFVKQIIFQFGTIILCSYWYDNWRGRFTTVPEPRGQLGGHAYRAIGYNPTGLIIANSWGKDLWGVNGIATMPNDIFLRMLAEGDCWKVVDITGV